jgi:hypothetical protein
MTVLPYLDIKATPIHSVELPQIPRTQSCSRIIKSNCSSRSTHIRTSTPKIRINARTDELLKQLPHAKTPGIYRHNSVWKPLTRELPDYDYLWEPLQREDIRHQYDYYIAPNRITASLPDQPDRMTTMFETQDRHYHNYRRVRAMQQRQWNKDHIQYTIYPYSHLIERELYK